MTEVIDSYRDEVMGTDLATLDDSQLDLYFKLHQKVNAKNQETSKTYKNNILVKFEDISELHYKIIQSITSLRGRPESLAVRVVVAHNEGEADKFNSFEEFKLHNITSPNPTSEIAVAYDFHCVDSEFNDVETYKVVVNLKSRIGELSEIEKEAPSFISSSILSSLVTPTARIKVEYSDYVKARHFIAMFDEWVKGCDESKEVPYLNGIKSYSHFIPKLGRPIVVAILGFYVTVSLSANPIDTSKLVEFAVFYASVFYIVIQLADLCLSKLEGSIDSYIALSYLNINKGDGKLIMDFKGRNRKSIFGAAVSFLGVIILGVFSSAVYDLIKSTIG